MAFGVPLSVIGLMVKGDLAGMTIYTDRKFRKVFFPQAPPDKPPTPMQTKQRARFVAAVASWKATSGANRLGFEQISLKANLVMTGHNLWIHVALKGAFTLLATLQRQTGITVDDPGLIPWPED